MDTNHVSLQANPRINKIYFNIGDVLTCLFYMALVTSIFFLLSGLINKSYSQLFIAFLLTGFSAFLGMWSIGLVLAIIALFELVFAIFFYIKYSK